MTNEYDVLIIGGGQSGLAAAYHHTRRGHRVAIIEAGIEPVGSWPQYYDSLTLFSPAKYSSLPGLAFPGDPDRYPRRDEVVDYLRRYAEQLPVDIHTGEHVGTVTHDNGVFTAHTDTAAIYRAPRLVAATGSFTTPVIPELPGHDTFTGTVLHARDYRSPKPFTGKHVIVVGAGNSAVQIAVELAAHATVTVASRQPVKFVPQRPLGRDIHFWFDITKLDSLPVGHLLITVPTQPVFDTGHYRAALTAEHPRRLPMFTRLDGDSAVWPDGTRTRVDAIITATGYHPNLGYLSGIGALTDTGAPRHRKGISTTHPGLGYLGLEWQRSAASNSLRGVGRDADYLTRHLATTSTARETTR